MKTRLSGEQGFWLGVGGIVLLLGIAIVRFQTTIAAVVPPTGDTLPSTPMAAPDGLEELSRRDSLISSSVAPARDPFQSPPPPKRSPRRKPRIELPVEAPNPTLRALLYDTVSPTVQLTIGEVTSGWLRSGEVFRGWTVGEITPTSVVVTNGIRQLFLGS